MNLPREVSEERLSKSRCRRGSGPSSSKKVASVQTTTVPRSKHRALLKLPYFCLPNAMPQGAGLLCSEGQGTLPGIGNVRFIGEPQREGGHTTSLSAKVPSFVWLLLRLEICRYIFGKMIYRNKCCEILYLSGLFNSGRLTAVWERVYELTQIPLEV